MQQPMTSGAASGLYVTQCNAYVGVHRATAALSARPAHKTLPALAQPGQPSCSRHGAWRASPGAARPSVNNHSSRGTAAHAAAGAEGLPAGPPLGGGASTRKGLGAHLDSIPLIGPPLAASYRQMKLFEGLKEKFLPMFVLFFCLSFVNTILDSLKDTLVITAAGGGAEVIPYLTVYAVLPSSVLFLLAFAFASQHLSRAALFNAIVAVFMAFFAWFGLGLYPNIDTLHPHTLADSLSKTLPQGLAGTWQRLDTARCNCTAIAVADPAIKTRAALIFGH